VSRYTLLYPHMPDSGISLSEECLLEHIAAPLFQDGVAHGWWDVLPATVEWPYAVFWLAPPARPNSPDRYYLRVHLHDYPNKGPTATLWDLERRTKLELSKWPKGNNDVAMVFRTDWNNADALYAPWDRIAMDNHGDWPMKHPGRGWKPSYTIVHYLRHTRELLDSEDYHGC
jgi:hypothetical protein